MVDALLGEWKLTDSQNFEELMKELGVNFLTRKIGNTTKPNVNFTKDGDKWTFTTKSAIKTGVVEFELDHEFEETTLDGRTVKVLFSCKSCTIKYHFLNSIFFC